jgi:hypothetical protein
MDDEIYTGEESAPAETKTEKPQTTAVIPRSVLGDVKPGELVSLRVTRVLENEIELEPAKGEDEEPEETNPERPMMDEMDQTLSGLTA